MMAIMQSWCGKKVPCIHLLGQTWEEHWRMPHRDGKRLPGRKEGRKRYTGGAFSVPFTSFFLSAPAFSAVGGPGDCPAAPFSAVSTCVHSVWNTLSYFSGTIHYRSRQWDLSMHLYTTLPLPFTGWGGKRKGRCRMPNWWRASFLFCSEKDSLTWDGKEGRILLIDRKEKRRKRFSRAASTRRFGRGGKFYVSAVGEEGSRSGGDERKRCLKDLVLLFPYRLQAVGDANASINSVILLVHLVTAGGVRSIYYAESRILLISE